MRLALRLFRCESLTLAEPVLVFEGIFGVILVLAGVGDAGGPSQPGAKTRIIDGSDRVGYDCSNVKRRWSAEKAHYIALASWGPGRNIFIYTLRVDPKFILYRVFGH